jgi:import inner membrane translocase subunit TIM44
MFRFCFFVWPCKKDLKSWHFVPDQTFFFRHLKTSERATTFISTDQEILNTSTLLCLVGEVFRLFLLFLSFDLTFIPPFQTPQVSVTLRHSLAWSGISYFYSMIVASKAAPLGTARTLLNRGPITSSRATYGRATSYSRLLSEAHGPQAALSSQSSNVPFHRISSPSTAYLQPPATQLNSLWSVLPPRRLFHSAVGGLQQQKQQSPKSDDVKSSSKPEEEESSTKDSEKQESKDSSEQTKEESGKKEGESEEEGGKKKEAPPPPPHGDKTPWQVFAETLQSEFKASKEWNESTKALASSAHQFSESESVKRARAAYEAASGAASSKTSSALRGTGKALGQGAAWTWDTPVVKGLRVGVSATGKGIEKATRPVRETEAYKTAVGGVKEAIDDGSSSRYGGWVEKEERRKQRELRELNAAKSGRSQRIEKMEEDPK